jgi:cell division protein FtsB
VQVQRQYSSQKQRFASAGTFVELPSMHTVTPLEAVASSLEEYSSSFYTYGQLAIQPSMTAPEFSVPPEVLHSSLAKAPSLSSQRMFHMAILLTIVISMIYGLFAFTSNFRKISILSQYQPVMERYYDKSLHENHRYQELISYYSGKDSIEELARNQLGLVSNDEVLVKLVP